MRLAKRSVAFRGSSAMYKSKWFFCKPDLMWFSSCHVTRTPWTSLRRDACEASSSILLTDQVKSAELSINQRERKKAMNQRAPSDLPGGTVYRQNLRSVIAPRYVVQLCLILSRKLNSWCPKIPEIRTQRRRSHTAHGGRQPQPSMIPVKRMAERQKHQLQPTIVAV
jgi:hypothetical protein